MEWTHGGPRPQELTNSLLNGTIPDPIRPPLPKIGGSQPRPKLQSLLGYLRNG